MDNWVMCLCVYDCVGWAGGLRWGRPCIALRAYDGKSKLSDDRWVSIKWTFRV